MTKPSLPASWLSTKTGLRKPTFALLACAGMSATPALTTRTAAAMTLARRPMSKSSTPARGRPASGQQLDREGGVGVGDLFAGDADVGMPPLRDPDAHRADRGDREHRVAGGEHAELLAAFDHVEQHPVG